MHLTATAQGLVADDRIPANVRSVLQYALNTDEAECNTKNLSELLAIVTHSLATEEGRRA